MLPVTVPKRNTSGWKIPVKDGVTMYPLRDNKISIRTTAVIRQDVYVILHLYEDMNLNSHTTTIVWSFLTWGCNIWHCTPWDYSLILSNVPSEVDKTWTVTLAGNYLHIDCNKVQVLKYFYDTANNATCSTRVKNKATTAFTFRHDDTASLLFYSEGKCKIL